MWPAVRWLWSQEPLLGPQRWTAFTSVPHRSPASDLCDVRGCPQPEARPLAPQLGQLLLWARGGLLHHTILLEHTFLFIKEGGLL